MLSSCISDKSTYDDEVPSFGELPFDHFILEKWGVTSVKTEAAQRTDLVKAWIALGSQGRLQRAQECNEHPNTLWVRTWYGNDGIRREKVDEEYKKLCQHTEESANRGSQFIRGNWVFEDHEQLLSDPIGVPTETGVTPPYVRALLELYPNILERGGGLNVKREEYIQSGEGRGKQHLMMVVVDKRACQTGAVLLIGVNDFGRMVPGRLRVKPGDVHSFCVNWDDGQRLDENFREGEEGEMDWYLGDDPWISLFVRLRPEDYRGPAVGSLPL
ncbi:hypothetical protein IFR05_005845 [Cadophora sp. M221]|nr:hypothetical protein IFR05_005845 [Cadophora sp. M221]